MKKTVSNVLKHLVCISLCIVVILPFYMVFINSLKPKAEAARMSLALPTEWHFETYLEVIEEANLVQGFFNSLTYAGPTGGAGVALPAGICNLIYPSTFFAIFHYLLVVLAGFVSLPRFFNPSFLLLRNSVQPESLGRTALH